MWEIGLVHQLVSSAYALIIGVVFAAVYDVLKAYCIVGALNSFAVFVKDIVFSLFLFFVTFMLLMARSNGVVRGYILFWIAAGFLLFRKTFSKIWFSFLRFVFVKLKLVFVLINKLLRKVCDAVDKFDAIFPLFFKKIFKKVKKLTKNS